MCAGALRAGVGAGYGGKSCQLLAHLFQLDGQLLQLGPRLGARLVQHLAPRLLQLVQPVAQFLLVSLGLAPGGLSLAALRFQSLARILDAL